MSYLDEVVRFIEKNAAGVSLGGGGGQYSDPYTGWFRRRTCCEGFTDIPHIYKGASRYQPASGVTPSSNVSGDPFTGASRYQPATNNSVPSHTGGGDPFTGASRYQPSPAPLGPAQSGYSDPFTGGNRYQPSPSPGFTPAPSSPVPSTPSSGNVIPHVCLGVLCRAEAS